jgi:uncharacterized protein YbjT (DUF2867 family)
LGKEVILVTGATGTVGSEVVKFLARKDVELRVAVRRLSPAAVRAGAEQVIFDLNRPETYGDVLEGVDRIFLLIPLTETAESAGRFVTAARDAGAKHILGLSALSAGAEPGIAMGRLHRRMERTIEDSGVPFTFLRPISFMQNFVTRMGQAIRSHSAFRLPLGDGRVAYIDARDVAAVAGKVLTEKGYEGKSLDLTGPEALSCARIAEIFSKTLGRRISYVNVGEEDARAELEAAGVPGWLVDPMLELYHHYRQGEGERVSTGVRDVTGKDALPFTRFANDYGQSLLVKRA